MPNAFTYQINPARIVFGPGTLARVAEEITGQGCRRALINSRFSQYQLVFQELFPCILHRGPKYISYLARLYFWCVGKGRTRSCGLGL